jgi:hypothetical protein
MQTKEVKRMKPKYSVKDKNGHWWVACSECVRGGNGVESTEENQCATGFDIKRGGNMGCFSGKLLSVYTEPELVKLKTPKLVS